jgi:hypothetical protein
MSRYAGTDHFTYPDSDVLRNMADIRNQEALDAFEADATAIRMLELYEAPISGEFDLGHLCAIHRHLFQDVYEWAGQLRTVDFSKGDSRFANWALIQSYLGKPLHALPDENWLRGVPPERFVDRRNDCQLQGKSATAGRSFGAYRFDRCIAKRTFSPNSYRSRRPYEHLPSPPQGHAVCAQ